MISRQQQGKIRPTTKQLWTDKEHQNVPADQPAWQALLFLVFQASEGPQREASEER